HWSTSKTPSYTKSVSWQHHPFNSDSVRMMQGFYDDELCNTLAQQHGIGIAAMIVKQLSPKHK
ncbi:rod-binding protein, partial [Escherichia coli]|uniref:rod-binding protein n=1 Tax=Escherichia coli TaxID=562 RepID=UPI0003736BE1